MRKLKQACDTSRVQKEDCIYALHSNFVKYHVHVRNLLSNLNYTTVLTLLFVVDRIYVVYYHDYPILPPQYKKTSESETVPSQKLAEKQM